MPSNFKLQYLKMITSKAIPICRSPFQGESLLSSSPKSVGALSSSPRRKTGAVTMAYHSGAGVRDPYSTLGVSPGATRHEIKKAYRRLALQYHPDVCDGNHCTTNFQQINHAYEVTNLVLCTFDLLWFYFLFSSRPSSAPSEDLIIETIRLKSPMPRMSYRHRGKPECIVLILSQMYAQRRSILRPLNFYVLFIYFPASSRRPSSPSADLILVLRCSIRTLQYWT